MGRFIAAMIIVVSLATGAFGYALGTRHQLAPARTLAADDCQAFVQTGKIVCGRFLEYWTQNGGLAQQGLPLSDAFDERSDVDGKVYHVQYFERAVFEAHPENARPYDVLLSLLGREKLFTKYPGGNPGASPIPAPSPSAPPPSPPPAPSPQPAYPRTATTAEVSLTVHAVIDPAPSSRFVSPDPGTRLVSVDVTLRNVGSKTFSSNPLYFYVRGADGRDYKPRLLGAPDPQLALHDLKTNDDTRGWVTFQVANGVSVTRVTFEHLLLDDPVSVLLGP